MSSYQPPLTATVLDRAFDPSRLKPGQYVIVSDTPAYFLGRAMVLANQASVIDDQQLDDGRQAFGIQVPAEKPEPARPRAKRSKNPEEEIAYIEFGEEYYEKIMREYGERSWRENWWREAIQNSVDAGSTRIDLSAAPDADGNMVVGCSDNGKGMDKETLKRAMFKVGGSVKGAGAAGGFGAAKELLLFPWMSWSIKTQDLHARGSGTSPPRITTGLPYHRGVELSVVMRADRCTKADIGVNFLAKCTLPNAIKLTMNGLPTIAGCDGDIKIKAGLNPGPEVRELAGKATLHHNKRGPVHAMLVRVAGVVPEGPIKGSPFSLHMFEWDLESAVKGTVTVELVKMSTDLLTSNRNGFSDWGLEKAVDKFRRELSSDTQSALKKKKNIMRTVYAQGVALTKEQAEVYRGQNLFEAERAADAATAMAIAAVGEVIEQHPKSGGTVIEVTGPQLARLVEAFGQFTRDVPEPTSSMGAAPSDIVEMLGETKIRGVNHYESAVRQLAWRPDFFIINETEDFKVPKKFLPEDMTPTVLKLAKVWAELCRFVLIQLGSFRKFGVGWAFSDCSMAMYTREHDVDWLLINPFKEANGDPKPDGDIWNPNQDEDLKQLYASAIHEVTHCADGLSVHNDVFAAALTDNIAKTADGWKRIKKIVAGIKTRAPAGEGKPAREHVATASSFRKLFEPDFRHDLAVMRTMGEWRRQHGGTIVDAAHSVPYERAVKYNRDYTAFLDYLGGGGRRGNPVPFISWALEQRELREGLLETLQLLERSWLKPQAETWAPERLVEYLDKEWAAHYRKIADAVDALPGSLLTGEGEYCAVDSMRSDFQSFIWHDADDGWQPFVRWAQQAVPGSFKEAPLP